MSTPNKRAEAELRREVIDLRRERNRLVLELHDERARAAGEARRIAQSRAWRLGHGAARLAHRLGLGGSTDQEGAPEALAESLERPLDLPPLDELEVPVAAREVEVEPEALERLAARPPLAVVVPIDNAPEELERCLAALAANSPGVETVLIDDASTDRRIESVLARQDARPEVAVLRNETNLGFAATVNRGFHHAAGRDVVVLNSDAEVTPRWLENLTLVAYSRPRVATVTPFSNSAGVFSAPESRLSNVLPEGVSGTELGRLVSQTSERLFCQVPAGNGFCMYLRRAALNEVGSFDAGSFPQGYGEETDFCMRASRAGWEHLLDDATFVVHASRSSFGDQKASLSERGVRLIGARYPEYPHLIRELLASPQLARARRNVAVAYRAGARGRRVRPRALRAAGAGLAGAPAVDRERVGWEWLLLESGPELLTLSPVGHEAGAEATSWFLGAADPQEQRLRAASILVSYSIELLEIDPSFERADELSEVGRALGIESA